MAEIPKIVGQRLQAIAKCGDHPDPNLLTAFVERSLGKRERVQVVEHLSQCTSCREIVPLSATQPSIADAVSVVPASAGWLSWPVLRWGALVACVMVVAAVVTLRQKHEARQIAATIAEGKPAAEMQLPVPNSVPNNAIEKKVASLQVPTLEGKAAFVAKQTASRQKAITSNPADGNHAAATSSPVEMADATTVPGRAKDAFAESQGAQAEKAVGGPVARKRSMVPAGAASDALVPANLAPRWTLSSDGTLQRSLDSGRTWQTIPVSSQTIFRALAANGLDIWVGGSAGALFHSSDAGQHWTQVRPIVNDEALEDDIIGVEFTDTLHGKLTSSIEETWITADAGQTWQKQ
ncbi:MAG TPA: YCF48-related protein [Terriglobales bacterium]|nr:YCF48-related protein [Terriglobales bacterium]